MKYRVTGDDDTLWEQAKAFSGADWIGWQGEGDGRSTYLVDVPACLAGGFTHRMTAAGLEVTPHPDGAPG
jgi:hypothetical protein